MNWIYIKLECFKKFQYSWIACPYIQISLKYWNNICITEKNDYLQMNVYSQSLGSETICIYIPSCSVFICRQNKKNTADFPRGNWETS